MSQKCIWEYDKWDEYHMSECKHEFVFTDGDWENCGFKFCPYCGLPIEFAPVEEEL